MPLSYPPEDELPVAFGHWTRAVDALNEAIRAVNEADVMEARRVAETHAAEALAECDAALDFFSAVLRRSQDEATVAEHLEPMRARVRDLRGKIMDGAAHGQQRGPIGKS
jgi:hypothetical protein